MASPTDRKNQLVWESIESGSAKQALQLCNRRIKKGEQGDYLMVLKAHVLTILGAPANLEEALGICELVAKRQPPINDVDVLMFLHRVWGYLDQNFFFNGHKRGSFKAEVGKLWEAAMKKWPNDEKLGREWFWAAIRSADWREAQKAAMHLQRAFLKRRDYFFWAIMTCLLLHNSLPADAPERRLFGTLAYRMIIKAKEEVPPEAENLILPPRSLHTAQDIHLLLSIIYSASPAPTPTARSLEALAVVDSKNLGLESKIGKGDWLRLIRRKLALLQEVGDWKALWFLTGSLLEKAQEPSKGQEGESEPGIGDDWILWEGYLKALCELAQPKHEGELPGDLSKEELKKKSLATINGFNLKTNPQGIATRNSGLALVKFTSLFHGDDALPEAPEGTFTLFEACKNYFNNVGSKSCCFEDLGKYVERFTDKEKEDFLEFLKSKKTATSGESGVTANGIAISINIQKFTYLLEISPLPITLSSTEEDPANALAALAISEEDLSNPIASAFITKYASFAASSLEIYISSVTSTISSSLLPTDNQHGDDAALLTVMALLRLWRLTQQSKHIFRAILILEVLLTKSRHNYQALLLLTRIYLLLGAPYLAASAECWGRLNIKQIQHDTLGHCLLTRGSTIFPFPPPTNSSSNSISNGNPNRTPGDTDLVASLRKSLGIYYSSRKQTPDMCVMAFEKGSYGQVEEFVEFGERVQGSICRGMWEIEKRRAGRLRASGAGGTDASVGTTVNGEPWVLDMLGTENGRVSDNRDYGVLINCEGGGKRFEEMFRLGSIPGETWTRAFSIVESMIYAYTTPAKSPQTTISFSAGLTSILATPTAHSELTPQETSYLLLASYLSALFSTLSPSSPPSKEILKSTLEPIKSWFNSHLPSSPPTSTSVIFFPPSQITTPSTTTASWSTLHTHWLALEACTVTNFLLSPPTSPSQEQTPATTLQKTLKSPATKPLVAEILKLSQRLVKEIKGSAEGIGKALLASINEEEKGGGEKEKDELDVLLESEAGITVFGGEEGLGKVIRKVRSGQSEGLGAVGRWRGK